MAMRRPPAPKTRLFLRVFATVLIALTALLLASVSAQSPSATPFARVEPSTTVPGYLARLLINETPFPGERAYLSEANTRLAMIQILWVLDVRLHLIPDGYTQKQVAGIRSDTIVDIIAGPAGRPQCEGFSRNAAGRAVTAPRVEERLNYLLKIANSGSHPGKFADLLNYAQGLASAYQKGGIEAADKFAGLRTVGKVAVTGRAYSWMTDVDNYNPGGNFVTIPNSQDGSLGGNRFFTLRKDPK